MYTLTHVSNCFTKFAQLTLYVYLSIFRLHFLVSLVCITCQFVNFFTLYENKYKSCEFEGSRILLCEPNSLRLILMQCITSAASNVWCFISARILLLFNNYIFPEDKLIFWSKMSKKLFRITQETQRKNSRIEHFTTL